MGFEPEHAGSRKRIGCSLLPPRRLVAAAMDPAVVRVGDTKQELPYAPNSVLICCCADSGLFGAVAVTRPNHCKP
jgi:hypothetical protein